MRLSQSTSITISLVVLVLSIFVWVLLLTNPVIRHCPVTLMGLSTTSFFMLLEMNPISSQLVGWGLMVIAMMLPKLIPSIQFIYTRSFKNYRLLCSVFFVLGYLGSWMVAGTLIILVVMLLNLLIPLSYIPAVGGFVMMAVWQFSPIKQRFLNRGHHHKTPAAFGWVAHRDSFVFGVLHGAWCVGAGWALMMFPMLLREGHNLAMIVVTFVMLSEHLEHPRSPQWYFDLRLKLLKIIIAQTRIKVKAFLAR